MAVRKIVQIDMEAFYASVKQRERVGRPTKSLLRGIVTVSGH
jgi:nucleotidyltransferase/DNA polymerase involved in DNA repair